MSHHAESVLRAAGRRRIRVAFSRRPALVAVLLLVLIPAAFPLPPALAHHAPVTRAHESASPTRDPTTGAHRESPGEAVARQATRYVGYPYLLAGVSPTTGFDCSGFTWYIVHEALGRDIGRSVGEQWSAGQIVPDGNLQPGDLVFFADTWGPGLTHVGIYVGGGQFIHAENEMTGVVISDLGSDYYAGHYAGAARIA